MDYFFHDNSSFMDRHTFSGIPSPFSSSMDAFFIASILVKWLNKSFFLLSPKPFI